MWVGDVCQVAETSDVIFSIVGYPKDVREIMFGDYGVLSGIQSGKAIVDMTTSEPDLAVEISKAAEKKHCFAMYA